MSDNNRIIQHEGIITAIEGRKAQVQILVKSACGDCHIKGACSISNEQIKIIEADIRNENFIVNEKVLVKMKESLGLKAVLLAYILPVIIIVLSLFISLQITDNENIAALFSLLVTAIYFISLYFFRNNIRKTFSSTVSKLS